MSNVKFGGSKIVSKVPYGSGTVVIEVLFFFSLGRHLVFILFPFPPSTGQKIGETWVNRGSGPVCSLHFPFLNHFLSSRPIVDIYFSCEDDIGLSSLYLKSFAGTKYRIALYRIKLYHTKLLNS